jgi:hypothetical protein
MAEIARRLGVCTSAIGRAVRKIEGRDERLNFSTPAPSSPSQTFGDFLGFNPHCHVLVTDGGFYGRGIFRVAPPLDLKKLEAIFRHKVFKIFLAKGRITRNLISMLSNWRHSGFHVFCGNRLGPKDETAMGNLARTSSRLHSIRNGCSISKNRQKLFTERKTEPTKRPSMP